jgi:hypothetical protein
MPSSFRSGITTGSLFLIGFAKQYRLFEGVVMKETQLDNVIDLGYTQEQAKQPFTMAFCYPKVGPVLIKGALEEVEAYRLEHFSGLYHYRLCHWRKGKTRGSWRINNPENIPIAFREMLISKGDDVKKKYDILYRDDFGHERAVVTFEKVPHEYIEMFDLFQKGEKQ